jgi:hypothetical protein
MSEELLEKIRPIIGEYYLNAGIRTKDTENVPNVDELLDLLSKMV